MKVKDLKRILEQVPEDYNVVTSMGEKITDEHFARVDHDLETVYKDNDTKELCMFMKMDKEFEENLPAAEGPMEASISATLMEPGLTGNGNYYSPEVLEKAVEDAKDIEIRFPDDLPF